MGLSGSSRSSTPKIKGTDRMTAFWRAAGLNYVQYSNIAAKVVRRCLKPEFKADAGKREITSINFAKWEGGKQVGKKEQLPLDIAHDYFRYLRWKEEAGFDLNHCQELL